MTGNELLAGYWWVVPLIMIALCCFFMRRGASGCLCGFGNYRDWQDSAMDILDKRFARGEIEQAEYEEKREKLGVHHARDPH